MGSDRKDSLVRWCGWFVIPLVAGGGLLYPWLGLTVIGIMVTLLVLGLLRGKYWCGNLCPHGSLFDLVLAPHSRRGEIPALLRSGVFKWAFFVYFMAAFVSRLLLAFTYWREPEFTASLGGVFVLQYLVWPTLGGIGMALAIHPRTWCSFCPMGTMQGIMYKAGNLLGITEKSDIRLTMLKPDPCTGCRACSRACVMQLEPYRDYGKASFHDNCIRCGVCVAKCPRRLLALTSVKGAGRSGMDEQLAANF